MATRRTATPRMTSQRSPVDPLCARTFTCSGSSLVSIGKSDNSHRSFAESYRASERSCRPQSSSLRRQQRSLLLSQLLRPCRCSARCPRPPQWRCSSSPRTSTTTSAPERSTWGWEVSCPIGFLKPKEEESSRLEMMLRCASQANQSAN